MPRAACARRATVTPPRPAEGVSHRHRGRFCVEPSSPAADWVATEKFSLKASAGWLNTGGDVDFWSGNYAGAGGYNGGPLVNYATDNTKTQRFMFRGDYKINTKWNVSAG